MSDELMPPRRLLLVGYGNDSRRDDGVAAHILRGLLQRLGADVDSAEGEVDLGRGSALKVVFLHQLAPELSELVADYDVVVFVDAHVDGLGWEPLSWQRVEPAVEAGMVGHHLKPGVVVLLAETLYGHRPEAYLLSVLGHDFDFGTMLSAETTVLADEAIERLVRFANSCGPPPAHSR